MLTSGHTESTLHTHTHTHAHTHPTPNNPAQLERTQLCRQTANQTQITTNLQTNERTNKNKNDNKPEKDPHPHPTPPKKKKKKRPPKRRHSFKKEQHAVRSSRHFPGCLFLSLQSASGSVLFLRQSSVAFLGRVADLQCLLFFILIILFSGSTFIRWGRKECTNNSQLVYSGKFDDGDTNHNGHF